MNEREKVEELISEFRLARDNFILGKTPEYRTEYAERQRLARISILAILDRLMEERDELERVAEQKERDRLEAMAQRNDTQADLDDAMAMLREVEWGRRVIISYNLYDDRCHFCEGNSVMGEHAPDCRLAAWNRREGDTP